MLAFTSSVRRDRSIGLLVWQDVNTRPLPSLQMAPQRFGQDGDFSRFAAVNHYISIPSLRAILPPESWR